MSVELEIRTEHDYRGLAVIAQQADAADLVARLVIEPAPDGVWCDNISSDWLRWSLGHDCSIGCKSQQRCARKKTRNHTDDLSYRRAEADSLKRAYF